MSLCTRVHGQCTSGCLCRPGTRAGSHSTSLFTSTAHVSRHEKCSTFELAPSTSSSFGPTISGYPQVKLADPPFCSQ